MDARKDKVIELIMKRLGIERPVVGKNERSFFHSISYNQLAQPFVKEYIDSGATITQASIKFGVTRRTIQKMIERIDRAGPFEEFDE